MEHPKQAKPLSVAISVAGTPFALSTFEVRALVHLLKLGLRANGEIETDEARAMHHAGLTWRALLNDALTGDCPVATGTNSRGDRVL